LAQPQIACKSWRGNWIVHNYKTNKICINKYKHDKFDLCIFICIRMYLPTSQNVSGFADGCSDIEMVSGGGGGGPGKLNSLAT
jgi:hypothetical protein